MMAAESPELRCADADRDRVAAQLREHFAQGRLNLDEFQERTNAVYAAKTFGDLATMTRDLPSLADPADPPENRADDDLDRQRRMMVAPWLVLGVAMAAWVVASAATGHPAVLWPAIVAFFVLTGRRGCGGRAHDGR